MIWYAGRQQSMWVFSLKITSDTTYRPCLPWALFCHLPSQPQERLLVPLQHLHLPPHVKCMSNQEAKMSNSSCSQLCPHVDLSHIVGAWLLLNTLSGSILAFWYPQQILRSCPDAFIVLISGLSAKPLNHYEYGEKDHWYNSRLKLKSLILLLISCLYFLKVFKYKTLGFAVDPSTKCMLGNKNLKTRL